jgi:DNA-binding MarR family transcriptional regulator
MTVPDRDRPVDPIGGLGFLLDRVAHSLGRDFADVLAPFGLGNTQLGVLSTLDRYGPMNQSRIAAYLGIERQQMVNLVNQLQQRGLVERRASPRDRRSWSVRLTGAGAALRARAATAGSDHARDVFGGLTDSQRQALTELLIRLVPRGHFENLFTPPTHVDET